MIDIEANPPRRSAGQRLTGALWRGRALLLLLALVASAGAPAAPADWVALDPGILVDRERAQVYVAAADGFAQAHALGDGHRNWRTRERAYPLAMHGQRLIALGAGDRFGIATLLLIDAGSGATLQRATVALPAAVAASMVPAPTHAFTLAVDAARPTLRIHWRSQQRRARLADDADGGDAAATSSGWFDLDVDGEQMRLAAGRIAQDWPENFGMSLRQGKSPSATGAREFLAVDSAHVLASRALDARPPAYAWTLFDGATGERLGSLESSYALARFLVVDGLLLYVARPLAGRAASGDWTLQPMRLAVHDLARGSERWSVATLDPEFRGAPPP